MDGDANVSDASTELPPTPTRSEPETHEAAMRRAAIKAYYGIRALALIPAMIVLGLVIYVYDRLSGRSTKQHARNESEGS